MKWALGVLAIAVAPLVFWFAYSPEHWLSNMGRVPATVDGNPVRAELYIGNPTHSEAEAIALFRVPGAGAYLLSFDEEKYREASEREFLQTRWGSLDLQINASRWVFSSAAFPSGE